MKVWIDGVETTNFQYADLPYNVTIYVSEKYTHKSVPNALVGIREIDGNLMFIPQIVVGATTEGYVLAPTDQNGYASFLIVPTKYASPPTYRIEAIIVNLSEVLLSKSLTISDIGSNIIKQVSPSELQQKTMDKIQDAITVINSLKEWMDENKCFNSYTITVQTDGTYSVSPSPFVLKTGAPNFLKVYLSTPTGTPVSGKVEIGEFNGILLLHPTNATVSFDSTEWEKTFKHIERDISTGEEFVVVPTSYGSADSTITLKIYDANNMLVKEISASIEREVSLPSGSPCSISQTMMDRVSNIKWVINNLRYALGG